MMPNYVLLTSMILSISSTKTVLCFRNLIRIMNKSLYIIGFTRSESFNEISDYDLAFNLAVELDC